MSAQIINLSLPEELVRKIDRAAQGQYANRSEFIRQAVVSRLQAQDSNAWATLVAGADEVRESAERAGYLSEEDLARAVKELRKESQRQ